MSRDALELMVERIREDAQDHGSVFHRGVPLPANDDAEPLTVSLARFQSYRARTTAALFEEIEDWAGLGTYLLSWQVRGDVVVLTVY